MVKNNIQLKMLLGCEKSVICMSWHINFGPKYERSSRRRGDIPLITVTD